MMIHKFEGFFSTELHCCGEYIHAKIFFQHSCIFITIEQLLQIDQF